MTFWTSDKVKTLTDMWNNESTSTEIAATLDCTRSAVMGKITRLGLTQYKQRANEPPPQQRRSCEFFLPNGEMCGDDIYQRSFCEKHYKICYLPSKGGKEGV